MKTIIIGASSGIGRALAVLLANNGHTVAITGRRAALLEELKREKPDQFHVAAFDVTDEGVLENNLNAVVAQLGGLDLLIYSSGIGELNEKLDIDLELPTIDVNVKAFNATVVWAYHYFEKQQHGQLVTITSLAGLRGSAIAPAYGASKAYQINYLEGLRQKAAKQKLPIFITDVRAGFVDTAMAKAEQKFWVASPEKAAFQIFNAIKYKKSVIYVSRRWRIIAWLLKMMPRFLYQRL
jgi:short-subunit dehydrogenase